MTAPEPTAVERTIAEVVWTTSRADEGTISATGANHVAQAVVAAIRNLPPEQMAQLVDGGLTSDGVPDSLGGWHMRPRNAFIVVPWREVTAPATPARDLTPGARDV